MTGVINGAGYLPFQSTCSRSRLLWENVCFICCVVPLCCVFLDAPFNHKHTLTYHRVCNLINTTVAASGAGIAYPSGTALCFVDRCLCFFFWPLFCLSFSDLRILITTLVSSNYSFVLLVVNSISLTFLSA
jgi:hypothetical protein